MFCAHQLHLPNDLRIFRYPVQPVYAGPEALVFDGCIRLDTPLFARSYLFRQRWLEIFITFDQNLHLRPDAEDSFPFAFNCDLTTPYVIRDNYGYTIDLFLDVLVGADGRRYEIRDRAAFEQAVDSNSIPLSWRVMVEREIAWLTQLLDTQQFVPMLQCLAPFPTEAPEQLLSVLERGRLTEDNFPDLTAYPWASTVPCP